VREAIRQRRPASHFGQQIGDADARQHGVEPRGQSLSLRRGRLFDRRDLQYALVDRDAWQQAVLGTGFDRRQPFVQLDASTFDEALEICFDGNRQRASLQQVLQGLLGDQPFLERAILPAASHPYLAGAQSVSQFR
jgi:hypothetical protein